MQQWRVYRLETGTIEPDKFAGIIVMNGNPLIAITILQYLDRIKMVTLKENLEVVSR